MNTFSFNGTQLNLQPSDHKWLEREPLGQDGNGRFIYPALREYELSWQFMSASDFNELQTFFNSVGATGSVVAALPQYGASSYTFFSYTGCILSEPMFDNFFEEHYEGVRLLVSRIRT